MLQAAELLEVLPLARGTGAGHNPRARRHTAPPVAAVQPGDFSLSAHEGSLRAGWRRLEPGVSAEIGPVGESGDIRGETPTGKLAQNLWMREALDPTTK